MTFFKSIKSIFLLIFMCLNSGIVKSCWWSCCYDDRTKKSTPVAKNDVGNVTNDQIPPTHVELFRDPVGLAPVGAAAYPLVHIEPFGNPAGLTDAVASTYPLDSLIFDPPTIAEQIVDIRETPINHDLRNNQRRSPDDSIQGLRLDQSYQEVPEQIPGDQGFALRDILAAIYNSNNSRNGSTSRLPDDLPPELPNIPTNTREAIQTGAIYEAQFAPRGRAPTYLDTGLPNAVPDPE